MITPKVHLTLPEYFDEDERDEERHFAPIIPLLEGLIKVNEWHMRRALRRTQKGLGSPIPPLYASGVRYKEDPPGQENWKDCLAVLADGHGDCLPLPTLVFRQVDSSNDGELIPLLALQVGDLVMGNSAWTTVREVCITGEKRMLSLHLDNGCQLRCSRAHKVFVGKEARCAQDVKEGDDLAAPAEIPANFVGGTSELALALRPNSAQAAVRNVRQAERRSSYRVVRIVEDDPELCMDITTDSGSFWLPESDVLVHNCDRLVAYRAAELRVAGYPAEPLIKWRQIPKDIMVGLGHPAHMIPEHGVSMVHVCVGLPGWRQYTYLNEDNPLVEDPSKRLGMGGAYTSKI